MSILFGVWKNDEQSVDDAYLSRLGEPTRQYADATFVRTQGNIGMGFQLYQTHERAELESQPLADSNGNLLAFDGRLDNHTDLQMMLDLPGTATADSEIVLAAFRHWGEGCFTHFVGDWAIALWSAANRTLYLARDHAGARTLYFELKDGRLLWSTYLETFFVEPAQHAMNVEFIFRYLISHPTDDHTPFEGIRAVPAAHYLRIEDGAITAKAHWTWMVRNEVRYRTDSEYEEHFLSLFEKAVERRTGSGAPVIAQLSGGMDSSSIVCISDRIRRRDGALPCDLIETISHYDDAEAGWNERPYFEEVERARGKTGIHMKVSFEERTFSECPGQYLWPGADSSAMSQEQKLYRLLNPGRFRAILSGLGGDELLGGVPASTPELADLLVGGRLGQLCNSAYRWCLPTRTPLLHELIDVAVSTWNIYFDPSLQSQRLPDWILKAQGVDRRISRNTFGGSLNRIKHRPSRLFAGMSLEAAMRALPHLQPGILARYEFRYPYLDRDLVDYLLAIPRTQLVRPGRRRHLMRNAMKGIVPDLILERKRKASIQRAPIVAFHRHHQAIKKLFEASSLVRYGFCDPSRLHTALESVAASGTAKEWPSLFRAVSLELWLKSRTTAFSNSYCGDARSADKGSELIET